LKLETWNGKNDKYS